MLCSDLFWVWWCQCSWCLRNTHLKNDQLHVKWD